MFGEEDDDLEVHYDRKQGLYTPYDDKRNGNENDYQDMENVVIEPQREYDLRSKTSQQAPNTKTSDKSSQSSTAAKQKDKIVVVNSDKDKEKNTQNSEKQSEDISNTNTSASTPSTTVVSSKTNQQAVIVDRGQLIRLKQVLQRIKPLSALNRKS